MDNFFSFLFFSFLFFLHIVILILEHLFCWTIVYLSLHIQVSKKYTIIYIIKFQFHFYSHILRPTFLTWVGRNLNSVPVMNFCPCVESQRVYWDSRTEPPWSSVICPPWIATELPSALLHVALFGCWLTPACRTMGTWISFSSQSIHECHLLKHSTESFLLGDFGTTHPYC